MNTLRNIALIVTLLLTSNESFADFVLGSSTTGNTAIGSSWTRIREVRVTLTGTGQYDCLGVASADVDHPGENANVELKYRFVLSRNSAFPAVGTSGERQISLINNEDFEDPDSKPVSVNFHWFGLSSGEHVFYFLGRKDTIGTPTTETLDSTLSVMCVRRG